MIRFLKREKAFIIAIFAIILITVLEKIPAVFEYNLLEAFVFLFIFAVIIYAALGVVHHAELIAFKLGEPYGTMVLTFSAVTVEIIMIAAMMLHGDSDPILARDTIFSTLMILINALIGFIMLAGGFRFGEQKYNLKSSNSYLSMIIGIIGLGMFLPNLIKVESYYIYQGFLIITLLTLYFFFIRMQSKEQNYYFTFKKLSDYEGHHIKTGDRQKISGVYHSAMLLMTIAAISLLAENLAVFVDDGIAKLNMPDAVAGLLISIIIVTPEGLTAIRAGLNNDMQRVINISLGSVLSTVSLTIPVVLIVAMLYGKEIILGLTTIQSGMIIISLIVSILTCKDGETNALQGFIHVILFIAFVFMIFL
jgi:Ca2+:H+ antiporter